jgi:hypothetical protein
MPAKPKVWIQKYTDSVNMLTSAVFWHRTWPHVTRCMISSCIAPKALDFYEHPLTVGSRRVFSRSVIKTASPAAPVHQPVCVYHRTPTRTWTSTYSTCGSTHSPQHFSSPYAQQPVIPTSKCYAPPLSFHARVTLLQCLARILKTLPFAPPKGTSDRLVFATQKTTRRPPPRRLLRRSLTEIPS